MKDRSKMSNNISLRRLSGKISVASAKKPYSLPHILRLFISDRPQRSIGICQIEGEKPIKMCLHWNYICVADICHYSLEFQPILTGKNQKRRSESKPHNHIRCQSAFVYSRQTKSPSVKHNETLGKDP